MAFVCIDQIICLQQDLIIHPVNASVRVMMGHKENDPFKLLFREIRTAEEFPHKRLTFRFLKSTGCIAIFLSAERTGDIMDNGCRLQDILCLFIQAFHPADGPGKGMHLHKMVDIVMIACCKVNHLFHDLLNLHMLLLLLYPDSMMSGQAESCPASHRRD